MQVPDMPEDNEGEKPEDRDDGGSRAYLARRLVFVLTVLLLMMQILLAGWDIIARL